MPRTSARCPKSLGTEWASVPQPFRFAKRTVDQPVGARRHTSAERGHPHVSPMHALLAPEVQCNLIRNAKKGTEPPFRGRPDLVCHIGREIRSPTIKDREVWLWIYADKIRHAEPVAVLPECNFSVDSLTVVIDEAFPIEGINPCE